MCIAFSSHFIEKTICITTVQVYKNAFNRIRYYYYVFSVFTFIGPTLLNYYSLDLLIQVMAFKLIR